MYNTNSSGESTVLWLGSWCYDVTVILIGIVSYLHDADDDDAADGDGVGSPLSQLAARLGSRFRLPSSPHLWMTQISAVCVWVYVYVYVYVCVYVNAGQLLSVESSTNLHNQRHHHLLQQQQQQQQLKPDDGDGHTDGAAVEAEGWRMLRRLWREPSRV